jgi:hypothetical protein
VDGTQVRTLGDFSHAAMWTQSEIPAQAKLGRGAGGPGFERPTPLSRRVPRSCVFCKGGCDAAEGAGQCSAAPSQISAKGNWRFNEACSCSRLMRPRFPPLQSTQGWGTLGRGGVGKAEGRGTRQSLDGAPSKTGMISFVRTSRQRKTGGSSPPVEPRETQKTRTDCAESLQNSRRRACRVRPQGCSRFVRGRTSCRRTVSHGKAHAGLDIPGQ